MVNSVMVTWNLDTEMSVQYLRQATNVIIQMFVWKMNVRPIRKQEAIVNRMLDVLSFWFVIIIICCLSLQTIGALYVPKES